MSWLTPLVDAGDVGRFGGKAAELARSLNGGIPTPDGFAISADAVERAQTDAAGLQAELSAHLGNTAVAVRSSAIDEDGATASFAGAHESLLGQRGSDMIIDAIRQVYRSASSPGALAYRAKLGLHSTPRMGIVVQHMIPSDVAGVMFTRNPLNGSDERVIEASWGLGEAVVSSLVTPDYFRVARGGTILQRTLGEKDAAIVMSPHGGTVEIAESTERVDTLCLSDRDLVRLDQLATDCDMVWGPAGHDIEFAFAAGELTLLQRRPITRG